MAILKDIGKVTTLSNKAKVGADINTDSKVNIDDIMAILKIIGGVNKHSDLSINLSFEIISNLIHLQIIHLKLSLW